MKTQKLKLRGSIFLQIAWLIFYVPVNEVRAQYNWKLTKDKDGIRVYESPVPNSDYKSIKVECILEGSFDKLIGVLSDIDHQKDWVYNNKSAYLLKKNSAYDYYYYSETFIPWPMSNRDAIIHLTIRRDSLDRFLIIKGVSDPTFVPEKDGKVRVPKCDINWFVTMAGQHALNIVYTFQAEPGGSLPAWLVNMFDAKGPFETFSKLSAILKK